MKQYLFSVVALTSFAALHGAALTPNFAASAVAQCSFAAPGPVIRDVYCLPSQGGDTAVCFEDIRLMHEYDMGSEQPGLFQNMMALFGIVAQAPAPIGSCTVLSGRSIKSPHDITCVTTDVASDATTCFDQDIFCSSARPAYPQITCFEGQAELSRHEAVKAAKMRSDWNIFLSYYTPALPQCLDVEFKPQKHDIHICPIENESLNNYVARIFTVARIMNGYTDFVVTKQDDFHEGSLFWQLPWTVQRYLACAMIEARYMDPNEAFSISQQTLLDHAAQNKDEEMIFWLWDKKARKVNHQDTLGYIIYDVMLKSKDARSLQVLRSMMDEGIEFHNVGLPGWAYLNWASDLDSDLVQQKAYILKRSRPLVSLMYTPYWDVRASLKNGTPGEQALFKSYEERMHDAGSCQIQ